MDEVRLDVLLVHCSELLLIWSYEYRSSDGVTCHPTVRTYLVRNPFTVHTSSVSIYPTDSRFAFIFTAANSALSITSTLSTATQSHLPVPLASVRAKRATSSSLIFRQPPSSPMKLRDRVGQSSTTKTSWRSRLRAASRARPSSMRCLGTSKASRRRIQTSRLSFSRTYIILLSATESLGVSFATTDPFSPVLVYFL